MYGILRTFVIVSPYSVDEEGYSVTADRGNVVTISTREIYDTVLELKELMVTMQADVAALKKGQDIQPSFCEKRKEDCETLFAQKEKVKGLASQVGVIWALIMAVVTAIINAYINLFPKGAN